MSSEQMLSELESGRELASENTQQSARCLKLLSAFAVIALVAGCGYLLFTQGQSSTSSHSNWKATLRGAEDVSANSANPIPLVSDKLTWQEQAGIAFSYGVEFSNNSLLIKKPGFYFIYTQVVFHYDQCEESTIFLSHDVHKLSLAYPEETILLRATKSVCHHGSHSDPWFKTSYQGAIFEFEAGDRIFSRVSENVVKYLDKTEGKTFFGIFA
eukprot:g40297.t1